MKEYHLPYSEILNMSLDEVFYFMGYANEASIVESEQKIHDYMHNANGSAISNTKDGGKSYFRGLKSQLKGLQLQRGFVPDNPEGLKRFTGVTIKGRR